jgi:hypothetical protein
MAHAADEQRKSALSVKNEVFGKNEVFQQKRRFFSKSAGFR